MGKKRSFMWENCDIFVVYLRPTEWPPCFLTCLSSLYFRPRYLVTSFFLSNRAGSGCQNPSCDSGCGHLLPVFWPHSFPFSGQMNKVTTVHSAIRMQSSRNRNLLKPSGRARLLIGYDGPCNRERLVRQREGRLEPATFYLLGHFDYLLGQLAPVLNMLKASDREREPEREGRINIKKKRERVLYISIWPVSLHLLHLGFASGGSCSCWICMSALAIV